VNTAHLPRFLIAKKPKGDLHEIWWGHLIECQHPPHILSDSSRAACLGHRLPRTLTPPPCGITIHPNRASLSPGWKVVCSGKADWR